MIAAHLSLDYGPCQEHLVTWDKVVGTLTHISKRLAASNQQERNTGVRSREAAPLEQGVDQQHQPFKASLGRGSINPSTRRGSGCASGGTSHRHASPGWTVTGAVTAGPRRSGPPSCGGSMGFWLRRRTVGMAREVWGWQCRRWTT
jgi:hypothetical protein